MKPLGFVLSQYVWEFLAFLKKMAFKNIVFSGETQGTPYIVLFLQMDSDVVYQMKGKLTSFFYHHCNSAFNFGIFHINVAQLIVCS